MIAVYTRDGNYEALLCEYAAGTLDEQRALVVETHMTFCIETRQMVLAYQSVGGALLEACDQVPVSKICLEQTLAKLDHMESAIDKMLDKQESISAHDLGFDLPSPLHGYVLSRDDTPAQWKKSMSGMMTYDLPMTQSGNKARLIKMPAGLSVPSHGHGGQEITLVLHGQMTDENGTYRAGDLIIMDEGNEHTPAADSEVGCICLAVSCAPIKLKGWASVLNPFLGK